jgi:hypothetical protein
MATNLPISLIQDSAAATKLYFGNYGDQALEFLSNDVAAAIAFFIKAGFDQDAAEVTALTILRQAKIDNEPIFKVLDTLKNFSGLQISFLVGEILNNNRVPTSTLGFRVEKINTSQTRSILA